jgi:hypothetical protein
VDQHPITASLLLGLGEGQAGNLATERRKVEEARRLAAARGDYVSAERWYRQEQLLDSQLTGRGRGDADIVRA